MATKEEPSFAGQRLAVLRKRKRLTAAELADRIPGGAVTKTMITNTESGRKRDLTATELVQLASALGVSPLVLLLDLDHPWETSKIPALSERDSDLTNIELARKMSLFHYGRGPVDGLSWAAAFIAEALLTVEVGLASISLLESLSPNELDDPTLSIDSVTDSGEPFSVSSPGSERVEEHLLAEADETVAQYRGLLMRLDENPAESELLTPPVRARLEKVRRGILDLVSRFDVDYGHANSPWRRTLAPPLNPKTGLLDWTAAGIDLRHSRDGSPQNPAE